MPRTHLDIHGVVQHLLPGSKVWLQDRSVHGEHFQHEAEQPVVMARPPYDPIQAGRSRRRIKQALQPGRRAVRIFQARVIYNNAQRRHEQHWLQLQVQPHGGWVLQVPFTFAL